MSLRKFAEFGNLAHAIFKLLLWLPRTRWPLIVAYVVFANLLGAGIDAGFLKFALPPEDSVSFGDLGGRGSIVFFFATLALCVAVSTSANLRYALPTLLWTQSPANTKNPQLARERALRLPTWLMWTSASVWFLGSTLFAILIARYSLRQAIIGAIASLFSGCITCMIIYLRAEKVLRPIISKAIADGAESRHVSLVSRRVRVVWFLCSGLPVLAIFALAFGNQIGFLHGAPHQIMWPVLILAAITIAVGLRAASELASGIGAPVRELRTAMRQVERGDLAAHVEVTTTTELGLLQSGFNDMLRQIREREQLRALFGQFVGSEVAHRAFEDGVKLGGEERFVAVIFADLVGSTKIAYQLGAEKVVTVLNEFFNTVVDVVDANKGFVNKFQGDATLAVFGAPLPLENPAVNALRAARMLQQALNSLMPEIHVGIGVSAGRVVAGYIGSDQRLEYTVIGDAVNEAARLSELAKSETGQLLASASTVHMADSAEKSYWVLGEEVSLRGRGSSTQLARVMTRSVNLLASSSSSSEQSPIVS